MGIVISGSGNSCKPVATAIRAIDDCYSNDCDQDQWFTDGGQNWDAEEQE
jgi:hypothetical protein